MFTEVPMSARSRLPYALVCAAVAFALSPGVAVAQAVADSASPVATSAGRDIYHGAGTCQVCHGMNLEGSPLAPTLKAHAWKDAPGGGYDAILNVITKGVPGTAMIGRAGGISDADAQKVAAYVWAVSHAKTAP
jgi:mono/diheme cytochrome c family protein